MRAEIKIVKLYNYKRMKTIGKFMLLVAIVAVGFGCEQCDHQCFANETISDAELTKMIWGPWGKDDDLIEFGYGYEEDSLAYYWKGNASIWEGYGMMYRFRVEDSKIWFYTDEYVNEIMGTDGLNISFSSCFSLETNCLHIYRFTVDGSNFFPLTLRRY